MADDNAVTIQIDGDPKGAEAALDAVGKKVAELADKADKASGGDGKNEGIGKLTEAFKGLGTDAGVNIDSIMGKITDLALGPIGALIIALGSIKEGFDLALKGEQLEKNKERFDILSKSAGVYGDTLLEALEKTGKGFYNTNDLITIANGSFIKLGQSARELPQMFELAQKAAKVFGGDATERLDQISNAIGRMMTRSLRDIGLKVDEKRVWDQYAASLGVTVAQLTEAEKKQALLNAVLERGEEKFKGIKGVTGDPSMTMGLKAISTGFKNLEESIAKMMNGVAGQALAGFLMGTAHAINTVAEAFEKLNGKPTTIAQDYERLNAQVQRYQELQKLNPNLAAYYQVEIDKLQKLATGAKAITDAIAKAKEQRPDLKVATEDRPIDQAAVDAATATADRINKIKADKLKEDQKNEAEHNAMLDQIYNEDEHDFYAKSQAKFEKAMGDANAEYNSEVMKNNKIKDLNEKAAANDLALSKRLFSEQKAMDEKQLADKKSAAEEKKLIQKAELEAMDNMLSAGLELLGANSEAGKAIMVTQAIEHTYAAATLALATYPLPWGAIVAASAVALGLANVDKIMGANDGALVMGGSSGVDNQPFMLSKGELVAPERNFDEVVEGTAMARGFTPPGGSSGSGNDSDLLQQILDVLREISLRPIVINGDFLGDSAYISMLAEKLRDAVQFRGAKLA